MEKLQKKIFQRSTVTLLTIIIMSSTTAEEAVIKQEKLSFEKCLKVISTSQDKLSLAPEIKDVSTQKRIAVFTLGDGTLTIVCDGVEGNVRVTTNTN